MQGGLVLGVWWVMAWVRQYSAPNVVEHLIFYTINPLLYEKRSLCIFEPPFGGLAATYTVHLRLIGKLIVDFLLVTTELFLLGAFILSQSTHVTDGQTDAHRNTSPAWLQRGKKS